jgi:penicillin-binding protein 1A
MRRLAAPVCALAGALALLGAGCAYVSKPLPSSPAAVAESSRIFAADGTLLTTLYDDQNRQVVPIGDIPKVVQDAVVAIEDQRFWTHDGVDVRAVLRAGYANASKGAIAEGGSTITQQYVKNELLGSERTTKRKIREAALAYQVEHKYSKPKILELYLNSIYFGNGAYGIEAAAHQYFGIPARQLQLGQAALLAGVIHAPTTTDPFAHPDEAAARRRTVLDKMASLHVISADQAASAGAAPLGLRDRAGDERYPAPHFVEAVKRFVLDDTRFGATAEARRKLLFTGGLRIYTTLDLAKQTQAEASVAKVLSAPGKDPEAAVVSIESSTGYVRALVGGRRFFDGGAQGKFDLATQGHRPAGSSFKPFVLAAALEKGIPLSRVYSAPSRLSIPLTGETWNVSNYEGEAGGSMDLVDATVHSINTVYAQLILDVGPQRAVELAARMGIKAPLAAYPSAVLGTNDVSPLDMATAYTTFANRGVAVPPTMVLRILGPHGEIVYQHERTQKRVLPAALVDTETGVLTQVVDRGTGVNARIGRPVAGKTGTGEKFRDAWFVGFTPELTTAVWVGFADAQRSMVPPTTRIRVQGGSWPAQIWQLYSSAALAAVPVSAFHEPPPPDSGASTTTTIPTNPVTSVVGMRVALAQAALTRDGFRVVQRDVPSADYPPGYVVGQSPAGGAQAPGGSAVTIDVSNGPPRYVAVPDVLTMNESQARQAITKAGFSANVVHESEASSSGAASRKGQVWKQSPSAGTNAAEGSTITVWVNSA